MYLLSKTSLYCLIVALTTMQAGFALAFYSASYITLVDDLKYTSTDGPLFNAISSITAAFGAGFIEFATKRLGRKKTTIASQIIILIGWIIVLCTFPSFRWLGIVGRAVTGIGLGATTAVTPVYINELSPEKYKGAFGIMSQLLLSVGSCLCYCFGIFATWRVIVVLCLIPMMFFFFGIYWVPDVSFHLEEAKEREPILQKKFLKIGVISLLTVIFQQFSGINALKTNLTPIFINSKITMDSRAASALVTFSQIIPTLCASPIIKNFGRKVCWSISTMGQFVFLFLAFANEYWDISPSIPVACLFLDVLFFGFGLGPLPWSVVAELFPDNLRSKASSINQGINWFLASVMIYLFPIMVDNIGIEWVYLMYSIFNFVSTLFGIFILTGERKPVVPEEDTDKIESMVNDSNEGHS